MKVLIVDKLSGETVGMLQKLSLEVETRADLTCETLPGALADTDILVVRSTKVSKAAIESAPQLSLIIRAEQAWTTLIWRAPAPAACTWPTARGRTLQRWRSWRSACLSPLTAGWSKPPRRCAAKRGAKRIRQGARALRPDTGNTGLRSYRQGSSAARFGFGHAGARLVAKLNAGTGRAGRNRLGCFSRSSRSGCRCCERASCSHAGDQTFCRRTVPVPR